LTLVGIVLHEHQADDRRMWPVGEVVRRVGLEKKAPVTFSMSGITMEAILRCCSDVAKGMQWDFANRLTGWDPHKPELVISTHNHMPIVLPGLPLEYWGAYFEGFVAEQVGKSKSTAEGGLHRTPRGIFPPEMMFAPAAAHTLQNSGLQYALIPGEVFGDHRWAKGQVYYVGNHNYGFDIKLLPRVNDISIGDVLNNSAYGLKERIKHVARSANIGRVVIGWDMGHFTGLYHYEGRGGYTLHDGITRLCQLADEIRSDPELHLVNCGAVADSYHYPRKIYDAYREMGIGDPHHFTITWMNGNGDLSSLSPDKVRQKIDFVIWHTRSLGHHDGQWLQDRKNEFYLHSGTEHMMHW